MNNKHTNHLDDLYRSSISCVNQSLTKFLSASKEEGGQASATTHAKEWCAGERSECVAGRPTV